LKSIGNVWIIWKRNLLGQPTRAVSAHLPYRPTALTRPSPPAIYLHCRAHPIARCRPCPTTTGFLPHPLLCVAPCAAPQDILSCSGAPVDGKAKFALSCLPSTVLPSHRPSLSSGQPSSTIIGDFAAPCSKPSRPSLPTAPFGEPFP
jgi:hypothetical protein